MKLLERTITETYRNPEGVVFSVHHTQFSNGDGVTAIEEEGKEFLTPPAEVNSKIVDRDELVNIISNLTKRNEQD